MNEETPTPEVLYIFIAHDTSGVSRVKGLPEPEGSIFQQLGRIPPEYPMAWIVKEYHDLWSQDPSIARAMVRSLGDRALGLAVLLSAEKAPGTNGSTYEYWLREWAKLPLPSVLRDSGWVWNTEGNQLVNPRLRLELHAKGEDAIKRAMRIMGVAVDTPPPVTKPTKATKPTPEGDRSQLGDLEYQESLF